MAASVRSRVKTLYLIRHAKSSWEDTALVDKDRPLNDRGQRDAPTMGERLAKRNVKPDLILSSPAVRALTTAEIIAKKLDYRRKDIVVSERLYAVEADDLLDVIHQLGDKVESVMLFGHNPELTELAHCLSGQDKRFLPFYHPSRGGVVESAVGPLSRVGMDGGYGRRRASRLAK